MFLDVFAETNVVGNARVSDIRQCPMEWVRSLQRNILRLRSMRWLSDGSEGSWESWGPPLCKLQLTRC